VKINWRNYYDTGSIGFKLDYRSAMVESEFVEVVRVHRHHDFDLAVLLPGKAHNDYWGVPKSPNTLSMRFCVAQATAPDEGFTTANPETGLLREFILLLGSAGVLFAGVFFLYRSVSL